MDVFVYGTLTDPERVNRVVSDFSFVGAVTLDGLHRVEGEYPTLAPGGAVAGRVLRTSEIEALDRYEGVERGLYVRVSVPYADDGSDGRGEAGNEGKGDSESDGKGDGESEVAVYVGDPEALGADAEWPGDGSFAERVERFVDAESVVVRPRG